jgi:hypothetical protein
MLSGFLVMARNRQWRVLVLGFLAFALAHPSVAQQPVSLGLDHIPVAVADLGRASATYQALGFALKPGRPHENSIRNVHVKFPDGAGIELLTATKATDALSAHYMDLLNAGEGGAFVAFHARDTRRLHAALRSGGYEFRQDGNITQLTAPEFAYLFFVRDNRSPTDRPEHFAHENGAKALCSVWIATEQGEALARLLVQLGGRRQSRQVLAPDRTEATVVSLAAGEVVILSKQYQVIPRRPVIGACFRVSDLTGVRQALGRSRIELWGKIPAGEGAVVEPGLAHGMWIEFRGE